MQPPRIRVLSPDGLVLGEVTFTADLRTGNPLPVTFRPASYEALFRAHIAVMRAEKLPAKKPDKETKLRRAQRELRRATRNAETEIAAAHLLLADYNMAPASENIGAIAKAEAEAHYDTHTHSKPE